ncbi:MAG: Na(+)-translocating NADH-quinone reductase subunit C [Chromatiaceae bacterium]|nr:Na(+)-translocating NADH-quinone reductase subunit C [Chromatiaceae bacterium]MCP5423349.1 Na(+)-translocating NADH-quinone reductase subunit C [Chromatiaceae bacterium]
MSEVQRARSDAGRISLSGLFGLPNDDPRKTVAIAVLLCLVCSLIVSAAAVGLRPQQQRNEAQALKREILKVAGLFDEGMDVDAAFAGLDARLVDLASGEYVDGVDVASYDVRKASTDPDASVTLDGDTDVARIRSRAKRMPVYLLRGHGELERIILPVHGYGLWSTMYGLLALAPDGRTVVDVSFYDQRETAGLGGEVANPHWLSGWSGKQVADDSGEPRFRVAKGSVDPAAPNAGYQVDGLSGATLTSNGVTNLVRFWVGPNGYGPYLERIRTGREN